MCCFDPDSRHRTCPWHFCGPQQPLRQKKIPDFDTLHGPWKCSMLDGKRASRYRLHRAWALLWPKNHQNAQCVSCKLRCSRKSRKILVSTILEHSNSYQDFEFKKKEQGGQRENVNVNLGCVFDWPYSGIRIYPGIFRNIYSVLMSRNNNPVYGIIAHVDKKGCCTFAFFKEVIDEESLNKKQDFDDDDLPLILSAEQNAWNTFHVFRKWNSVSTGRLFRFIPLILIPESGQLNAPLHDNNQQPTPGEKYLQYVWGGGRGGGADGASNWGP